MRTWEMIKELTENPDKKFRRVGEIRELYVGVYNNFVAWEGDYALETGRGEPFEIYTDLEWEEVKQPVDFMTALKSRKYVKVEHDLAFYTNYKRLDLIMFDLADNLNSYEFAEVIENGKWYIED